MKGVCQLQCHEKERLQNHSALLVKHKDYVLFSICSLERVFVSKYDLMNRPWKISLIISGHSNYLASLQLIKDGRSSRASSL